jgi:hypothetical protein
MFHVEQFGRSSLESRTPAGGQDQKSHDAVNALCGSQVLEGEGFSVICPEISFTSVRMSTWNNFGRILLSVPRGTFGTFHPDASLGWAFYHLSATKPPGRKSIRAPDFVLHIG